MNENLTPEEKLLRLIRRPKDSEQRIKTKKLFLKPSIRLRAFLAKLAVYIDLQKALFAVFIISCLYLAAAVAYPLFIPEKPVLPEVSGENAAQEKITLAKESRPYEFYAEALKNKQIFSSSGIQDDAENAPVVLGNELIKDINLVGIINGDNPQAVIEDKKAQKTYYVSKNQIVGKFRVEDIQDGKIILGVNGQKYELYL